MVTAVISDQWQALITLQWIHIHALDQVKTIIRWVETPDLRSKHKLSPGTLKQEWSRQNVSRYKKLKWRWDKCNLSRTQERSSSETLGDLEFPGHDLQYTQGATCNLSPLGWLWITTTVSALLKLYSVHTASAQGASAILILSCCSPVHHSRTSDWCTSAFNGCITIL